MIEGNRILGERERERKGEREDKCKSFHELNKIEI